MCKLLRRMYTLMITLCILFGSTARAEWSEPFGQSFADRFQLRGLSERIVICSAVGADKLYAMNKRGTVYSYDVLHDQYAVVAQVTPWPSVDIDKPLVMQSTETKEAMSNAVTDLLVDERNALYGFNKMTGTFGPIDAEGVHWQSIHMDTSAFFEAGSDYPNLVFNQPQIIGNSLEGWVISDMEGAPRITLVSLSRADGSCSTIEIEGAYQLCKLSNNELLALVLKENESIALEVYDRTGRYVGQFEATLPSIGIGEGVTAVDLQNIFGPLAYDSFTDSLYFIDNTHLYCSVGRAPFQVVDSNVPWMPPLAYSKLQTINGEFVLVNGQWLWK